MRTSSTKSLCCFQIKDNLLMVITTNLLSSLVGGIATCRQHFLPRSDKLHFNLFSVAFEDVSHTLNTNA